MTTVLIVLLVALAVAIASTGVWVVRARARVRSFYAGRRDHLAGRVDHHRTYLDRAYFEGVIAQRIADTRNGTR